MAIDYSLSEVEIQRRDFDTLTNSIGVSLKDSTGASFGLLQEDGCITIRDYLQAIAEGDVANHTSLTKNGYNPALSSSEETLWAVGGDYVFPATAQQMEVISSSADDTSAGTGAKTVEVYYLDNTYTQKTETITLNGTTAVATVATNILRINNFIVKSVGTGGVNAGDIDIRATADTPIYSRIATGTNRAINMVYTVPKSKKIFIYNLLFSAGGNVANRPVRFITKSNYDSISGEKIGFFMPYTNVIITDGSIDVPLEIATVFPETVDLKINAISPDGATYGACTLRAWLENA